MTTNTIPCPLPQSDCEKLNKMLQNCSDLECIINVFKELGVDTTDMEAQVNRHKQFAQTAKAKFFPHNS